MRAGWDLGAWLHGAVASRALAGLFMGALLACGGGGGGDGGEPATRIAACHAAVDDLAGRSEADGCDAPTLCRIALLHEGCDGGRAAVITSTLRCLGARTCILPSDPAALECAVGLGSEDPRVEVSVLGCSCRVDFGWAQCPDSDALRAGLAVVPDADAEDLAECIAPGGTLAAGGCATVSSCVQGAPYAAAWAACGE